MDTVDVAELSRPTRRVPRWLRVAGVAVLVTVVAWLLFARATAPDVRAERQEPSDLDNHTVELPLAISSRTDRPLWVTVLADRIPGLDFRGAKTDHGALTSDHPMVLPGNGYATVTLTWRVADCRAARAAADSPAQARVRASRPGRGAELVTVDLGTVADLTPAICDVHVDGVPRLVDREIIPGRSIVAVRLTVANAGGRDLTFRGVELPEGWTRDPAPVPAQPLTLAPGSERSILLEFRTGDCAAPTDGPARVRLRFDGTRKDVVLTAELANSWANLLGVCSEAR
ncbi:MAG TPA: hypothetical protein VIL34_16155 [Actinopolymorphaceae bacterium]|mgnify:CR=1 FL=1|jgi:hypothetical protein